MSKLNFGLMLGSDELCALSWFGVICRDQRKELFEESSFCRETKFGFWCDAYDSNCVGCFGNAVGAGHFKLITSGGSGREFDDLLIAWQ